MQNAAGDGVAQLLTIRMPPTAPWFRTSPA